MKFDFSHIKPSNWIDWTFYSLFFGGIIFAGIYLYINY